MDDDYWLRYRRYVRRRAAAQMALVIAPLVFVGAFVKLVETHDYAAGDIRNDPLFWLVTGAFFVLVAGLLFVMSIHELRKRPPSGPAVPLPGRKP